MPFQYSAYSRQTGKDLEILFVLRCSVRRDFTTPTILDVTDRLEIER